MKSKFLRLLEDISSRYQRAGFLTGDFVQFIDNYKTHECYKKLSKSIKDKIEEFTADDLHIRVHDVKNKYPSDYPGSSQNTNGIVFIDLVQDQGGGRIHGEIITVPGDLLEVLDKTPNLGEIPDSFDYKRKTNIKPEPVEEDSEEPQSFKSDVGGKLEKGDRKLQNKNIKIPGEGAKDPKLPYTAQYMN